MDEEEIGCVNLEKKKILKKAVLFGVIAISLLLITDILDLIWSIYYLSLSGSPSDLSKLIAVSLTIGILVIFLFISFGVIYFIYLGKLLRSGAVFGKFYQKLIKWTIAILAIYIGFNLLIWPAIYSSLSLLWLNGVLDYGFLEGFGAIVHIISIVAFFLILILPIAPMANVKQRKVLVYSSIIYISAMVPLYELANQWMGPSRINSILITFLYIPAGIAFLSIFLYIHYKIWRSLPQGRIKTNWRIPFQHDGSGKLGRYRKKYMEFIRPNPYRSFIPIFIIAILFGSFVGIIADDPLEEFRDGDSMDIVDLLGDLDVDIRPSEETFLLSDGINEGEENTYEIPTNGSVSGVIAELRWTDEDDLIRRENQPDSFELTLSGGGGSDSSSGANAQGEEGLLSAMIGEAGDSPDMEITVGLIDAGDQKMKNGLGLIVWTDSSNEYMLQVTVQYHLDDTE